MDNFNVTMDYINLDKSISNNFINFDCDSDEIIMKKCKKAIQNEYNKMVENGDITENDLNENINNETDNNLF
ncbi:Hypothetical protein SRAE_X000234500 [Strongyloides ratti]|uniref:Uncharacterized protein n=1 Tax=Strongyloides ratti TaxID=34506 RepID=A0A090KSY5_STRRB|nr:Hypothetical protein SRAE_X000234500 [Strongyloides ratti]CEF60610.1 Hypothetical protein SRAE_X000234500 [Strongyloides ratti]